MVTVAWIIAVMGLMAFIAVHDVRHRLVLNGSLLVLLGLRGIALLLSFGGAMDPAIWGGGALLWSGAGALCAAGVLLLTSWLMSRGSGPDDAALGMGDVKLVACQGLCLSPSALVLSLFLASAVGLVWALVVKFILKEQTFPFAPALCLGFCIALLPASGCLPIL